MPDFKIEIAKPCRASWKNMTDAEQGKFCGECSKIVIDFTSMTTDEIQQYFLQHRDQKICGRFISTQISKGKPGFKGLIIDLHSKTDRIKYRIPRIAAVFVLSWIMTMTGCIPMGATAPEKTTTGDSIYIPPAERAKLDSTIKYTVEQDSIAAYQKEKK